MRVLLVPLGWPSHYQAMVSLGWALRTAGHSVRVAAMPPTADAVTRSALTGVRIGEDSSLVEDMTAMQQMARQRLGRGPVSMAEIHQMPEDVRRKIGFFKLVPHINVAAAVADDLVSYARSWTPDLVIADPMMLAAPLVSETLGVPLVHNLWGFYTSGRIPAPTKGMPPTEWPEEMLELYARFDVPVRETYAAATIDPVPSSLQAGGVPHPVPMRYVPYNGPGELPGWVENRSERPRICVTLGTILVNTQQGESASLLRRCCVTLAGEGFDVVVAVGENDLQAVEDLPDGVRVAVNLPLELLLPTCAAVVNHGGSGTVLTAALHGVPQAVFAISPEHTLAGEQLAAYGAGSVRSGYEVSETDIKEAVATVVGADVRAAAERLATEMRAMPSPADVVPLLESLAG